MEAAFISIHGDAAASPQFYTSNLRSRYAPMSEHTLECAEIDDDLDETSGNEQQALIWCDTHRSLMALDTADADTAAGETPHQPHHLTIHQVLYIV